MLIHNTLNEIFRAWSHVAVLRALLDTSNGFTGNEVARISGMHPLTALRALTSLEELGLVRRQRGGRDHLFTLNREHVLMHDAILPLYMSERKFPETIFMTISRVLKGKVLSAIVFGSVSRKEELPQSDFDLCCIVKSEKEKQIVRNLLHSASVQLHRKYNLKLAPIFFNIREFRNKARTTLIKEILEQGKVLIGNHPKTLIHDKTNKKKIS